MFKFIKKTVVLLSCNDIFEFLNSRIFWRPCIFFLKNQLPLNVFCFCYVYIYGKTCLYLYIYMVRHVYEKLSSCRVVMAKLIWRTKQPYQIF